MTSWRDGASEIAQSDLDGLLNAVLPFAQQQLDNHGEFLPFGAAVGTDGATRMLASHTGEEHPGSQDALDVLMAGVKSERDSLRAVALVSDVRLTEPPGDAIRVELEHQEGPTMAILLPYKKRRLGRGVDYANLTGVGSSQRIWAP